MGGASRMVEDPRVAAQEEAEKTFDQFIIWSKRITMYFAIFLCIVVFACNSGVETGPGKTGSQYDGSVYSPDNIKVEK
tara:strand:+ start:479 stop:712 length:234 start_codon:yes stop_codon:yes gene_type:complete